MGAKVTPEFDDIPEIRDVVIENSIQGKVGAATNRPVFTR
jgi:hypothetical protein